MTVARLKVLTHKWAGVGEDAHGNEIEAWDSPVEQLAYGWSTPNSTEPKTVGENRVVVQVELLTPEGFEIGPRDKVSLPGQGELMVIGFPEDFNNGPFGFRPGLVVNLRRADG